MTQEEKQTEIENLLYSIKGKEEVPPDVIAEILNLVDNPAVTLSQPMVTESDENLRMKIMDETDWRKRAAMAAMILSRSLD